MIKNLNNGHIQGEQDKVMTMLHEALEIGRIDKMGMVKVGTQVPLL